MNACLFWILKLVNVYFLYFLLSVLLTGGKAKNREIQKKVGCFK